MTESVNSAIYCHKINRSTSILKGSYIKDVRKILPIFDLPPPCPHLSALSLPPSPRAFGVRNLHPLKEKISTMLLIFCGTLDICQQPLVITYMPSSAVWVMACIRSLPNFLSWLWLTRSLTFCERVILMQSWRDDVCKCNALRRC